MFIFFFLSYPYKIQLKYRTSNVVSFEQQMKRLFSRWFVYWTYQKQEYQIWFWKLLMKICFVSCWIYCQCKIVDHTQHLFKQQSRFSYIVCIYNKVAMLSSQSLINFLFHFTFFGLSQVAIAVIYFNLELIN